MFIAHIKRAVLAVMRRVLPFNYPTGTYVTDNARFYEQESQGRRRGPMVWLSPITYIVEAPRMHAPCTKYYFVHYKDGIVLKLAYNVKTMDKILKKAANNPAHPASVKIDRIHRKIKKYVYRNRDVLFQRLINGATGTTYAYPTIVVVMNDIYSASIPYDLLIPNDQS